MGQYTIIFIRPTHYDMRGYPIRWLRSIIPSNTLAVMNGLAQDLAERKVLGDDIRIKSVIIDESNQKIPFRPLIKQLKKEGGLVAMVGVQTNQFPRALDIAKRFREYDIPVVMGGFHISGSIAMLPTWPPELLEARTLGITLFAGEAENGRFELVVKDAFHKRLPEIYDYLKSSPPLQKEPIPFLPHTVIRRTLGAYSSFDLGRGCPFSCSFCTIINVQGKSSRFRHVDDLEAIIRHNHAQKIDRFFITDDNLARNANWKLFFDRLIHLKEEGIKVRLQIQIDTRSHEIPGFIDKAVAAGVDQLFIGMESVSPENLAAIGKKQNRVSAYREMLMAWKQHPVIVIAGYIIGFPSDTPESVRRDVEVLKQELPIDLVYFSYLTPLPGSEDHQLFVQNGKWLDPDMNRYDLHHAVCHHPGMSDAERESVFNSAWEQFYSWEHIEIILKRMVALKSNKRFTTLNRLAWYREFPKLYGISPLDGGIFRVFGYTERRPTLPRESFFLFATYWISQCIVAPIRILRTYRRLVCILKKIRKDTKATQWSDPAISAG